MNTAIPLIIKTRWVNAEQNKNKIIYLEVSWYSLEQYIGCISRQAFNYYCKSSSGLRDTDMQALIWG